VVLAVLLAACSGSSGDQPSGAPASSELSALPDPSSESLPPQDAPAAQIEAAFVSDRALEALISSSALDLPARFLPVARADREPILTLGLVSAAARVTYSSATTNEILSVDILRLDSGVDPDRFFTAFADSIADESEFTGVRTVGVLRGIGDLARRITFSVEGDDGDAIAILRNDLVALATYRRPSGLRDAIEMGSLLSRLDESLSGAALSAGE
jgi:hypothetical protein